MAATDDPTERPADPTGRQSPQPPINPTQDARPAPPPMRHRPETTASRPPRRGSLAGRIVIGILVLLLIGSVLANVYLVLLAVVQLESGLASRVLRAGQEDQTIAVYGVSGIIDGRQAERFGRFARTVRTDESIRAVVVRVASPGGSVSASDRIHEEIRRIRRAGKTVVVSMGGVAASGGYYISAGADAILAEPTTLTGSIGVIAQWPVLSGTLEKVGAEMVVLKSEHAERWKGEMSVWHEPSAEQRRHLYGVLDELQAKFERVVVAGRGQKLTAYQGPAPDAGARTAPPEYEGFNGKIYLAERAKQLGLIDDIGYAEDAVSRAADLAGLDEPHVKEFYRRPTLRERMGFESASHLSIDMKTLDEFQTPRILFMWKTE
ncbi:MAG: S49 family peptidase [Planctomycetota bacterium]